MITLSLEGDVRMWDAITGEAITPSMAHLHDFFRHGMALNVAAAMDVAELSAGCSWVQAELAGFAPGSSSSASGK